MIFECGATGDCLATKRVNRSLYIYTVNGADCRIDKILKNYEVATKKNSK